MWVQALGWLALLLPTHQVAKHGSGNWNAWVARLLDIWQVVAPCEWFNNQILGFLARLAKHDRHGEPATSHHACSHHP